MSVVKLAGNIDENHELWAKVPASIPPGPVTVLIVPVPEEDDAGEAWAAGIATEWEDELSDSRQDIYTLADGEPVVNPDEIYLAKFPFGGSAGMKLRPVLVLTAPIGSVPEILVAYISSVIPSAFLPSDILFDPAVAEQASTKLKTVSVVRLHKLATIHTRSTVRRLGVLSPGMASQVNAKLRSLSNL